MKTLARHAVFVSVAALLGGCTASAGESAGKATTPPSYVEEPATPTMTNGTSPSSYVPNETQKTPPKTPY